MTIAVIGAGTMGAGIAQTFAQAGYRVVVRDLSEDALINGQASVQNSLSRMVDKARLAELEMNQILERVQWTKEIEAIKEAELVIEAAAENMQLKKRIFAELDEVCRVEAILATNTSSLSITEIASATQHPQRVVGMHFFNPVPVMKVVELIKGVFTDEVIKEKVKSYSESIGKEVVEVEEAPGFVVNRILIPMINEAVGILAEGIASVEDIDTAMKLGANHPMGPLALADLIGNDVNLSIMETLYEEFSDPKFRPHPLLRKMVRGGLLGRKTKKGFYDYNRKHEVK